MTAVDHAELRPCPFCGSAAKLETYGDRLGISCTECFCRTPLCQPGEDPLPIWNLRTQAPDSWRLDVEAAKTGADVLAFVPGLGMGQMVLFWMGGYWREKANCLGLKVEPTAWKPLSSDPPALRPQTAESGK